MNTNIKKRGRIAIAWFVIVTMVFATMYTPFAFASTSLDVHGITKVGAQTQYVIPAENDFVFIKQATASHNTYVLWTRDTLTLTEQHSIIDTLLKGLPGGDKSIFDLYVDKKDPNKGVNYDLVNYFSGFGKVDVTPTTGSSYSYTFSQNDVGQIILDNSASKISHIYYGQYNQSFSISVTKTVTLNESSSTDAIKGINGSVYVSLFTTFQNGIYSGLLGQKEIKVVDGVGVAPAVFSVANTGTYYVVETYQNGKPVTAPGMMFGKTLVSVNNTAENGVEVTTTSMNNVTITNNLTFESKGTGTVDASKILNGKDMTKDMFAFQLIETQSDFMTPIAGGVNETVGNEAALDGQPGSIQFSPIDYNNTDTHYYIIKEVKGSDPTISYDEGVINVTMAVTSDGEGNLTGNPSYSPEGKVFTNTYREQEYGSIQVTKTVNLPGGEPIKNPLTFMFALFDEEGNIYTEYEPLAITVNPGEPLTATGTFTGLNLDKKYTVYEVYESGNDFLKIETDNEGNVTTEGMPMKSIKYTDNIGIEVNSETPAKVTVDNTFAEEDFPLFGSVIVNKTVTVNGKAFASNRTFYVALFADKELTEMVSDVNKLKMQGKSSTTTEFLTDKFGNPLEAGTTYYIAETDKKGAPLTGTFEELGFEIDIDQAEIVITEEGTEVNIINNFKSEEFPLTGDDSNMNLWLFLGMLGVAGALAPFAFRKKEVTND